MRRRSAYTASCLLSALLCLLGCSADTTLVFRVTTDPTTSVDSATWNKLSVQLKYTGTSKAAIYSLSSMAAPGDGSTLQLSPTDVPQDYGCAAMTTGQRAVEEFGLTLPTGVTGSLGAELRVSSDDDIQRAYGQQSSLSVMSGQRVACVDVVLKPCNKVQCLGSGWGRVTAGDAKLTCANGVATGTDLFPRVQPTLTGIPEQVLPEQLSVFTGWQVCDNDMSHCQQQPQPTYTSDTCIDQVKARFDALCRQTTPDDLKGLWYAFPPEAIPQEARMADLRAVWGKGGQAWAVGTKGIILRWDGASWSKEILPDAPFDVTWNGVTGSDDNGTYNVWVVGGSDIGNGLVGKVAYWNGTSWSVQKDGLPNNLNGVWARETGEVWAVGNGGVVLSWSKQSRQFEQNSTVSTSGDLLAVAFDDRHWWTSDSKGSLWYYSTGMWVKYDEQPAQSQPLNAIAGSSDNLLAAGDNGTLLNNVVGTFKPVNLPAGLGKLTSIWSATLEQLPPAEKHTWVAGDKGTLLLKINFATWIPLLLKDCAEQRHDLLGLGGDEKQGWAVGKDATIWTYIVSK